MRGLALVFRQRHFMWISILSALDVFDAEGLGSIFEGEGLEIYGSSEWPQQRPDR